jgi:hypothetical protein
LERDGFDAFAFTSDPFACLFKVSGSGIPGVGVAPFGKGFPAFFGSGIPGVGVPFAEALTFTEFAPGIPGVEFPEGAAGEPVRPGGIFFGSMLVIVLAELAFGAVSDWQAILTIKSEPINTNKIIFVIVNIISNL